MSIDLNGFWQSWGVVSGNTQASNEYEFWKGMVMSTGQVLNNQFDFFTYQNTTRYEWFKALQSTYPDVWDEYTFYKNTNDDRIYDFYTFYKYCGEYLVPSVTPTPTPTNTPTPTPIPFCLDIVSLTSTFGSSDTDGNYDYIGNGYINFDTSSGNITLYYGIAPDSINYSLYQSGLTNYVVATFMDNVLELGPYNYWDGGIYYFGQIPSTISSGYVIPTNPSIDFTIDYPNCPTPTPTPSVTATNTPTPTPTPSPAGGDADATAYLAAVVAAGGTVNSTITTAVNTLYTTLKSNGIYSKLQAFYPIVGGVQNAHAVEGKNPGGSQDLTFNGSWVHDNQGMRTVACNSSNYADTQYLPTSLDPNSNHLFAYFNGTGTQFGTACGSSTYDGAGNSPYFILGHPALEFFSSAGVVSAAGSISAYGALIGTRTSASETKLFRSTDGSAWSQGSSTSTTAPSTYPNTSITIAKVNPAGFASSDRYAFFSFGSGLDDTESENYYNAVLAFETALGRQTYS
jgi:hypothetical protein